MLRRLSIVSVPERASVLAQSQIEGCSLMFPGYKNNQPDRHNNTGDRLVVGCCDGRLAVDGVDLNDPTIHRVRNPGSVLDPEVSFSLLESSPWGRSKKMTRGQRKFLQEALRERQIQVILLMIRVKRPKELVLTTHDHCAAVGMLCYDPLTVDNRMKELVETLVSRRVTIPIYGIHDGHCEQGVVHTPRLICAANVTEDAAQAVLAA